MQESKTGEEDWASVAAKNFAASAVGSGLKIPIEAVAEVFRQIETIDIDLSGIERVYSTEEAAEFFAKSPQWLYWAMNPREEGGGGLFYYPDGTLIEPERVGVKRIRRFTLQNIKDMGVSLRRKGTVKEEGLREIIRRIQLAKIGRWTPEPQKRPKRSSKKKEHGPKSQGDH